MENTDFLEESLEANSPSILKNNKEEENEDTDCNGRNKDKEVKEKISTATATICFSNFIMIIKNNAKTPEDVEKMIEALRTYVISNKREKDKIKLFGCFKENGKTEEEINSLKCKYLEGTEKFFEQISKKENGKININKFSAKNIELFADTVNIIYEDKDKNFDGVKQMLNEFKTYEQFKNIMQNNIDTIKKENDANFDNNINAAGNTRDIIGTSSCLAISTIMIANPVIFIATAICFLVYNNHDKDSPENDNLATQLFRDFYDKTLREGIKNPISNFIKNVDKNNAKIDKIKNNKNLEKYDKEVNNKFKTLIDNFKENYKQFGEKYIGNFINTLEFSENEKIFENLLNIISLKKEDKEIVEKELEEERKRKAMLKINF